MQKILEKHYKKIVFAILLFMAIVSFSNAWNDSAIFDETAHIGASYSYVTQNEIRLNPEHPPLLKDLAGLSILLFANPTFDISNQKFWDGTLPGKWDEGQWSSGRYLLYGAGNDADKIIFWGRFPIVILSLILGWFIFFWTRHHFGTMTGLLALTLYAFDPNILGHNHFVTTDLGAAAFFAFAFYFYLRFIKDPTWKNVALAGVFLGLLQLTKFSFIIGLPILALATLIYPMTRKVRNPKKESLWKFRAQKLGEYILKGFSLLVISLFVVWAVYFFNTFNMSKETVSRAIDATFPPENTQHIKEVYTRKVLGAFNENMITRPLAIYGQGIGYVFRRVAGGNGAYFMGEVSSTAFPAYFPTVFAIKEPFSSLFLFGFAIILSLIAAGKFITQKLSFHLNPDAKKIESQENFTDFVRHNIFSLTLFSFVILYSYVSITGNLNIGFRHLFPILPFVYILTAKVIFDFLKKLDRHSRHTWGVIVFIASIILITETISVFPKYMSYFNPLAGGPKNGYQFVTDSNADWGQDLKRLRNWVEDYNAHKNSKWCAIEKYNFSNDCTPIQKIHVNYFGGGDVAYYLGDIYEDWWDSKRPIEEGWYAISTNFSQGSIHDTTKPDNESYRWLKNLEPKTQIGTSIFIYYVTEEEAADTK